MQAACSEAAAGQRDVNGLSGEALVQERVGKRLTAGRQRGFHLLLDDVDPRAFGLARLGIEFAKALQQLGQRTRFAEKAGFLVLEGGDVVGFPEGFLRVSDNLVQIH
jgi:hypothetical protein